MSLAKDLRIIAAMVMHRSNGSSHADRLESFYAGQAEGYDDFRKRLLHGRKELLDELPINEGDRWVELGGGTGATVEMLGDRRQSLAKLEIVDLCPSLLEIARRRIRSNDWTNVVATEADATTYQPSSAVDAVIFSYSLTMIPNWFAAIDNAIRMLRPGGFIAVVDFYVSRKHPLPGLKAHGFVTRTFWPAWFCRDDVFPSSEHLPYLKSRFHTVRLDESRQKIPYLPIGRVPVYRFIGKRREE